MMSLFGRHQVLWDAASDAAAAAAAAGGNGNGSGGSAGNDPTRKTLAEWQTELNAQFALRAQQAERSREAALLAELGVPDVAAAKAKLKQAADAEAATLSDLEKAKKRADDEKARADRAEADHKAALERVKDTNLRSAVMTAAAAANVDPAEHKTLWLALKADPTLLAKIKPVADSDEFEGVDEVVKELIKTHPRWVATEPKFDINAGNRGGSTLPQAQEAVVARKRGQYAGSI